MARKKPTNETDDESLPFIVGTGSFDSFTEVPKDDKPVKRIVGFVRPKKKKKCTKR